MHDQITLEQETLSFWKKHKTYQKVKENNDGGEKFYFCDGPPYATGQIHPGTAWNKCLKDSVCRYKRARGFKVRAQPGFDTHGLPIEVKVEQELKLKSKKEIEDKIGVPEFIGKCKEFATQYIGVMSGQFERCGVWMDWDNPYVTYKDEYIENSWRTIKTAHEKGLLSRGVYVLPYCNRCETTLANYELEYGEQDDPSIYVKFKVKGTENDYLVIWTTTPWTLVSNIGVMVHPTYTYVKAKVNGENWIVAKDRLDIVMAFVMGKSAVILGEMSGKKLEGMKYEHPLQAKVGKECDRHVVLSDEYVTLEDGSGLVHCAPGHGPEDFIIGKRFGLEIYSPLDTAGKFTKEAGDYAGMDARRSNEQVIADLDAAGALIHEGKVRHRYPHCWRCKTPLIFLTTDQWFISISKKKERMLEEIEKCNWHPDFAKTRFREFVNSAPDWCISRQRYWGIPLPIWQCTKCSEMKVIGSRHELPEKVKELHKPFMDEVHFKCGKCHARMDRVPDILDVWFDSGNAVWASLTSEEQTEFGEAAEFIVEGKDQTRGWFYSMLGSGIVLHDRIPYKNLLMHGFFVDEKGEKMSKSIGNFVPLEDVIDKYGADTFRLWSLENTVWDDLRFNWDKIKEAHRVIGILYNMGIFIERFCPGRAKRFDSPQLELEDRWLLSRLNNVVTLCTESFDSYEPHRAVKACREFLVEDMSRFYLKLVKKRIADGRAVEQSYFTIQETMLALLRLLAPITPFIAEDTYQRLFRKSEKAESISLLPWPAADEKPKDTLLERQMALAQEISVAMMNARQAGKVKLRWPLEEAVIVSSSTEVTNAVQRLSPLIETMGNIKKISFAPHFKSKLEVQLMQAKIGAKFKQETAKVVAALREMPAEDVVKALSEREFKVQDYVLDKDMALIKESAPGYSIAEFSGGKIYLKTDMNKALYEEAMVREVCRRVQMMRKDMKLVESDRIGVTVAADKELEEIVEKHKDEFCSQVNATSLSVGKKPKGAKDWEIEDFEASISVEKE